MAKLEITLLPDTDYTNVSVKIDGNSVDYTFKFPVGARAEDVIAKIENDISGPKIFSEVEVIDNRPQPLVTVVDGEGASLKNLVEKDEREPMEGSIYGLNIEPNSANPESSVDIKAGSALSDDSSEALKLATTLTVSLAASGAGGLDTGSEAASSWYFVWLIHNPVADTYAGLLSLSNTAPTLPEGFTKKRRVGVVRNNSGSDILKFHQTGKGADREYFYLEQRNTSLRVLSNGNAGSYADVDCGSLIPSTADIGNYGLIMMDMTWAQYMYVRPKGETVTQLHYVLQYIGNELHMPVGTDRNIQYYVTGGSCHIDIFGFKEGL